FPYAAVERDVEAGRVPPRCPTCGGVLKPGSVLFGEGPPEDALDAALVWMRYADAVLVVGSSLVVHPVAALPEVALAMGASFVIVNEAPTDQDARADALVRARAGAAVPALLSGAGLLDGA